MWASAREGVTLNSRPNQYTLWNWYLKHPKHTLFAIQVWLTQIERASYEREKFIEDTKRSNTGSMSLFPLIRKKL